MSHHLKELEPDHAFQVAIVELDEGTNRQLHANDTHKLNFQRGFKFSTAENRAKIVAYAATKMRTLYDSNKHLEGPIWLVAAGLSHERDWDMSVEFLKAILSVS